ncbi:MAG: CCA tRNA nucleotidyltransferase [Geminicoccaceae bacterium]|nr:CCA tRNA nucleotidyltransferase [Geminicoccaceae bacterium]
MSPEAEAGASDARPLARARWLDAPESRELLDALEAEGKQARFVGGCVRDTLLDPDLDPEDLDLATQERPERLLQRLPLLGFHVVATGLKHGTVTVIRGRRRYEITTLRRDVACFGRHAEVEFSDDFQEDAARRDFTINAMSCDRTGRLYDYFGGREDLFAGRIRFVGEPEQRIREDFLRILRFFRFYARFGRAPAEPAALSACRKLAFGLDRLSGERIRGELERLLQAPGAVAALRLMVESEVGARIFPVAPDLERLERLRALAPAADWLLCTAALLRGRLDEAGALRFAARLRLSNRERDRLSALLTAELPDPRAPRGVHERLAYRLGLALWADLLRLAAVERGTDPALLETRLRELAGFVPPRFPLGGRDLLARGIPTGPRVGRLLEAVRRWWEDEGFRPDRAACLARLDALLAAESAGQENAANAGRTVSREDRERRAEG